MHARDQLRYLYGPGGLSDQLSALSGVGLGDGIQFSPAVARAAFDAQASTFITRFLAVQAATRAVSDPAPHSGPDADVACDCLMGSITEAFEQVTAGQLQQLQAACQTDPVGFEAALVAQAQSAGVSIDTARCGGSSAGTPWYKRPTTWVAVGAVGLGLAVLWGVTR